MGPLSFIQVHRMLSGLCAPQRAPCSTAGAGISQIHKPIPTEWRLQWSRSLSRQSSAVEPPTPLVAEPSPILPPSCPHRASTSPSSRRSTASAAASALRQCPLDAPAKIAAFACPARSAAGPDARGRQGGLEGAHRVTAHRPPAPPAPAEQGQVWRLGEHVL